MKFKNINNAAPHSMLKWMLRSVVFFTLMICCRSSYGQIFYYFEYKLQTADEKPLAYDIFLNIGIDGNAAARIAFIDPATGKNRLVKLNYVDNNFPDDSHADKITYLMPFGNAFDENDQPVSGFIMPWFEFEKAYNYALTNAVVKAYIDKQPLPLAGTYQEKQMAELQKDKAFVSRFYGEDEAFYKYVFNINTPPLKGAEKGRNLYMIAIAATDDPEIGETVLTDLQNMQTLFTEGGTKQLGINFKLTEITGKNFTKKAVNNAIDKLKPRPQDIVIVYYSGHGFRYTNDVSLYPRIALVPNPESNPDNDNLSIEDVYNRVSKKGAMVTLVLADCCNENYGVSPPLAASHPYIGSSPVVLKLNADNWRALFLPKHRMSLLACAADKGQLAAGNTHLGGFFTSYTTTELYKSLYGTTGQGEASWTRIINISKEYTRRQAQTVVCTEGPCDVNDRDIQTPEMKLVSGK